MAIEKRHCLRTDLGIEAQILYRGRSFSARTHNLSRDGLFLQTGPLTIPSGILIEISLTLGRDQWQIAGLVTRSGTEGIGVMFRMPQPELYRAALAHAGAALHVPSSIFRLPAASAG